MAEGADSRTGSASSRSISAMTRKRTITKAGEPTKSIDIVSVEGYIGEDRGRSDVILMNWWRGATLEQY